MVEPSTDMPNSQIHDLQMATSQPLGIIVQYSFRTVASLALALYTSWRLTLVTLAGIPIFSAIVTFLSTKMQPSIEAQQSELSGASKVGNSAITSIGTVKCLNGQSVEQRNFAFRIDKAAIHYRKHARINALQISTIRLMMFGMFVQGFWYGSSLASSGELSAGEVLRAFWLCLTAAQSIELGLPQAIVLEKGKVAAAALKKVLVDEMTGRVAGTMNGAVYPRYCEGDIEVKDVSLPFPLTHSNTQWATNSVKLSFAYATQPERPVLKSTNFFFPAGETTFVIGKSGSGKSTLGQLLMRFYLPTSGKIAIDGQPIGTMGINWIRNNMTLLEQKSILFNESILTNIAFGRRDYEPIDKCDIQDSIDLAMLQSTIDSMPNGINTCVGDGGSFLSGGQRQRVAIARAKLRDTPILILDEPTSALDSANRVAVTEAIREWRKGKTTIIITHDMAQIQEKDFVYVLEHGSIVLSGYRSELEVNGPSGSGPFAVKVSNLETGDNRVLDECEEDNISDTSDSRSDDTLLDETVPTEFGIKVPGASYVRNREDVYDDGNVLPYQIGIPMQDIGRLRVNKRTSVLMDIQDRRLSVAPFSRHAHSTNHRQSMKSGAWQTKVEHLSKQKHVTSVSSIMKTIIPSLTTGQRWLLLLGFLCAVSHATATPLFSFCMSQLFGTFYQKNASAMRWSLAVLGVAIGDASVSFFMHYLLEYCGEAWVGFLRKKALRCVLDQPQQWFEEENNSPSKLVACLDQNAEDMRSLIGSFAGFVLVAVTITVLAIIWSLASCWKLTLVALACGPVIYAITRGSEGTSGLWEKRCNEASRIAGEVFVEAFSEVRTVRALTLEAFFHRKHIKASSKCMSVGMKRAGYTGILFGLAESTIVFVSGKFVGLPCF